MPPDGLGKKLLVQHQPLILASASPRRRDLLRELGLQFRIVQAAVEEEFVDGEAPVDFACRLAAEKARAVAEDYRDSWVLAADTIVVRGDGIVLGKPENSQEACSMLRSLAGRWHEVMTAYSLVNRQREIFITRIDRTGVVMIPLTEKMISAYVDTGEPMDKAGSYALQGIGGAFVAAVDGAHSTVIGLPLHLVLADLLELEVVEISGHVI
jgi:septum formation protein